MCTEWNWDRREKRGRGERGGGGGREEEEGGGERDERGGERRRRGERERRVEGEEGREMKEGGEREKGGEEEEGLRGDICAQWESLSVANACFPRRTRAQEGQTAGSVHLRDNHVSIKPQTSQGPTPPDGQATPPLETLAPSSGGRGENALREGWKVEVEGRLRVPAGVTGTGACRWR